MKYCMLFALIFALSYAPSEAGGTAFDAKAKADLSAYYQAKMDAFIAAYVQVKKATQAGNFEDAEKWGNLVHKWEYDVHPTYIVQPPCAAK